LGKDCTRSYAIFFSKVSQNYCDKNTVIKLVIKIGDILGIAKNIELLPSDSGLNIASLIF